MSLIKFELHALSSEPRALSYLTIFIRVIVTGPIIPDSLGGHADASNSPFLLFCRSLAG